LRMGDILTQAFDRRNYSMFRTAVGGEVMGHTLGQT